MTEPLDPQQREDAERGYAQDVQRSHLAAQLKQNDLLRQILDDLEFLYITGWRNTAARDVGARELLWQAVQVVGKVRQAIDQALEDGRVSGENLQALYANDQKPEMAGL